MCETKNENSSNLLRGISENGGILFYGIDSTAIVRRMEQLHKTSAVTTAALGRLLTGVAPWYAGTLYRPGAAGFR